MGQQAFGYVFDLLGANGYMWKITHNVIHHTYTNITGVDEDLTVSPLLRLSPESPRLPIHRFQHLYAIAAYSTSTLFWVFAKDFKYFFAKELGPYKDKKHPPIEWVTLWVSKVFYILWAIVVPLLVLNVAWWQFLIGFLVMHLTAGAILGIVFQLAHVVEGPDFPLPDHSGTMDSAWMIHEMQTTANFGRNNKLLSLVRGDSATSRWSTPFPRVCSAHYPAISPIVEEVARECGVPYYAQPTFRAAVKSHLRMLKQLGQSDESRSRTKGVPPASPQLAAAHAAVPNKSLRPSASTRLNPAGHGSPTRGTSSSYVARSKSA